VAWEALKSCPRIFLRTEKHPTAAWLKEQGIEFRTFDVYYEEGKNFQEVYAQIAATVLKEGDMAPLVYAVPGSPLVAEETVEMISKKAKDQNLTIKIIPGMSFLDVLYVSLNINPAAGLHILDGLRLGEQKPDPLVGNIIIQVYNRLVASDVKLRLLEFYPPEHTATVIRAAGVPELQRIEKHALSNLDHLDWFDHLTSVYLPPCPQAEKKCCYSLDPLVDVLAVLRGEKGCPWDRGQTHDTLRKYLIEEAYEVIDAINSNDMHKICEELGDLLLQIVFHAQIASEKNLFDINEVIEGITEKMLRRHPHVFGDAAVSSSAEVEVNWEKIKKNEKASQPRASILDGIPGNLPALLMASRVQSRVSKVGFDWPDYKGARYKIREELFELSYAIAKKDNGAIAGEMGDLLFAVVNLARLLHVDAEMALLAAVDKFGNRFRYIEEKARLNNRELGECTLTEMDAWWDEAKIVKEKKKS